MCRIAECQHGVAHFGLGSGLHLHGERVLKQSLSFGQVRGLRRYSGVAYGKGYNQKTGIFKNTVFLFKTGGDVIHV